MERENMAKNNKYVKRWHYEDLPYDSIQKDLIVNNQLMFYLITIASFIEITSDLYTNNLVNYFKGKNQLQDWLKNGWEPEELQHGQSLKRYVQTVWPEFGWDLVYESFFKEYQLISGVETYEPTVALEMVYRCVVETGTCSLYAMIQSSTPEPILAQIVHHIRTDEAYHHLQFYNFFLHFFTAEKPSWWNILCVILRRTRQINNVDGEIAFKCIWQQRHPGRIYKTRYYKNFMHELLLLVKKHYPFRMAVNMVTKPMQFKVKNQRYIDSIFTALLRLFIGMRFNFLRGADFD